MIQSSQPPPRSPLSSFGSFVRSISAPLANAASASFGVFQLVLRHRQHHARLNVSLARLFGGGQRLVHPFDGAGETALAVFGQAFGQLKPRSGPVIGDAAPAAVSAFGNDVESTPESAKSGSPWRCAPLNRVAAFAEPLGAFATVLAINIEVAAGHEECSQLVPPLHDRRD